MSPVPAAVNVMELTVSSEAGQCGAGDTGSEDAVPSPRKLLIAIAVQ